MSVKSYLKYIGKCLTDAQAVTSMAKCAGMAVCTGLAGAATLGLAGLSIRYIAVMRLFDIVPLGLAVGAGWLTKKAAEQTAEHFKSTQARFGEIREEVFGSHPVENKFEPIATSDLHGSVKNDFGQTAKPEQTATQKSDAELKAIQEKTKYFKN